jgi:hypothetical protein
MYGEFLEERRTKLLYDKRMNNGGECVKVVGFVALPFLFFFSFVILEPSIMVVV